MSEEATFEKVKSIVVEQLGVDEEEFNIEIPDDVAEKIKTVKDTVDYIEKEKKA